MPITIKSTGMKYKNPDTGVYQGVDMLEEATIRDVIVDVYSPTLPYAVGEYCLYNGELYCCTTAIPSGGETWNSAHWDKTNVTDELEDIKGAVDSIGTNEVANESNVSGATATAALNTLNGAINSKAPINSPTFTGTPKGVTPTAGDNSTNIATTAFVQGEFTSHVFYKMLANNASYTFPISNGHCYMVFAIRVSTMGQAYGLWLIDSWGGIVATANMQAVTISYSNGVGTVTNISGGYVNVAILDFPEK